MGAWSCFTRCYIQRRQPAPTFRISHRAIAIVTRIVDGVLMVGTPKKCDFVRNFNKSTQNTITHKALSSKNLRHSPGTGGQKVAGSNPVTPIEKSPQNAGFFYWHAMNCSHLKAALMAK